MNNFEIRTNKKKATIISVAQELFKAKGFVNVSIKEIASKSNVSQVSIYNYFGNKDALVGECVKSIMNEMINAAREILNYKMNFKDKVIRGISLCSDDLNKSFSEYFTQEALKDSTLLKLITEFVNKEKLELFREYIEVGKEEGAIDKTISTETILRFIEAILLNEDNRDLSTVHDGYFEEMQKLILHGMLVEY